MDLSDIIGLNSTSGSSGTSGIGADFVSDTAYDTTSWDGVTAIAPSKNAVRDEFEKQFRAILTTAGDIGYASAANTLARLAKGATDTKLFMNATGTAPEWTSGIKLGTFSRDTSIATGTQAVSGVGFKPSHIIFLANVGLITPQVSIGFSNGVVNYLIADAYANTIGTWTNAAYALYLLQTAAIYYLGSITAIGADGFTVTWTKVGAKTGTATIYYMAFR